MTTSLIVNNHLNMVMEDGSVNPDVWVLGDAAVIEEMRLPATAQGGLPELSTSSAADLFYSCQPTS